MVVEGSPGADLLLPALVLLLGALATTGVITLVGDESPVRVLAVVAAALTAPLWVVPGVRVTAYGASLSGELVTTRVTVVRTAALLLVLVIGAAVLLARRPAPAPGGGVRAARRRAQLGLVADRRGRHAWASRCPAAHRAPASPTCSRGWSRPSRRAPW